MRRWPRVPRLRALPRAGGCGQRVHGVEHHDEFAWLGDAASHAVSAQLAAEREYTQLHLQPLASAEMELYGQMASSIPAESESAPEPWGTYEYYTRTPARRDLPRFCRRRRGGGGEEVLLDLGALADRHGFASLGAFALSPNQRMLAYTLDTSGAEESSSPRHLPYISPISPLYLPYISPISPLYLLQQESFSPLHLPYLPYISPISPAAGELQHATSPLYLPHVFRISPL